MERLLFNDIVPVAEKIDSELFVLYFVASSTSGVKKVGLILSARDGIQKGNHSNLAQLQSLEHIAKWYQRRLRCGRLLVRILL